MQLADRSNKSTWCFRLHDSYYRYEELLVSWIYYIHQLQQFKVVARVIPELKI